MAAVANVSFPIQYIVNHTLQSTDPLAAIMSFTPIYARSVNGDRLDCFDWAAGGSAGVGGAGGVQEGPYFHMVCTYFPISMDNTPENTIFPAANASHYACGTLFGPGKTKMLTQVELEQKYNYSLEKISGLTNFIGLWGQYDPLTGLFPHDFPLKSSRQAARKIFVSGMAHTGDMIAQSPLDPDALVQVKRPSFINFISTKLTGGCVRLVRPLFNTSRTGPPCTFRGYFSLSSSAYLLSSITELFHSNPRGVGIQLQWIYLRFVKYGRQKCVRR